MSAPSSSPPPANAQSTGIALIDEGYCQLRAFIERLHSICDDVDNRQTCADCPSEQVSACEFALLDCVTDLLGYMVDQFRSEENLMKGLGISTKHGERYQLHAEDHANITGRVAQLARPRDKQQTVRTIAEAGAVLTLWLDHHISNHDVPMLR